MAHVSPLRRLHQQAEAAMAPYGPPLAEGPVELVETYGDLELEYAALRKGCVLLDQPQRATIEATGAERLDFLNRMITQELRGLEPLHVRRSFWLNRKGRIDADLRVVELGDRTLLDLDVHAASRTLAGLTSFLIAEDVQLRDISASTHRLALHGPTGPALLRAVSEPVAGPPVTDLAPGRACIVAIAGQRVVVDRDDSAGEVGLELLMDAAHAVEVYHQLVEAGHDPNGNGGAADIRLRPAGWHAYNIARIEAGTPLYNLDFGPDSLPHETGVLHERVSFKKGCYLGQEIVARLESRGHPSRRLVALRCERRPAPPGPPAEPGAPEAPRLPATGDHVFAADKPAGDPVGAVTSSTLSPMLGSTPIAFAMVRWAYIAPGTRLLVSAEGERVGAEVQPTLAFWKRG